MAKDRGYERLVNRPLSGRDLVNPPGLGRGGPIPSIFDNARHRNLDMGDAEWSLFSGPLEQGPFGRLGLTDSLVIACLVEAGMPRLMAEQVRYSPRARKAGFIIHGLAELLAKGERPLHPLTGEPVDIRERLELMLDQYRGRELEGGIFQ